MADYGTNGGSAFTRSSTVPARSDTVLVSSTEYNSDGEGFKTIDPMGTQTRQEFDAAGRQTKLIENYIDGDPATGASDEDRTTITAYNADGQVKTLTAKNPTTGDQVTKYVYGSTLAESGVASSQLLRAVIYPDSDDEDSPLGNGPDGIYDRVEYKYNRQGERTELKDQRETVHVYDHDKLGRLIHDRVTELGSPFGTPVFSSSSSGSSASSSSSSAPGASSSSSSSGPGDVVDGSVRRISRTYEVRGMLQNVSSHDNPTVGAGNVVNDVQFVYNTFGQLVTEYQEHDGAVSTSTTPKVQYAYAGGGANHVRRTSMTYPNGRILRYEYNSGADDNLGRVSFLADDDSGAVGTHLAEYTYLGLGTVIQVDYTEPEIRYDLVSGAGNDPYDGLDRFDRVVDCLWRNYGTSTDVDRIKHGYDRASNRLWRENTVASAGFDELYFHDGLYQLKDFERGDLNAGKTAITGLAFAQEWSLDATGNWSAFKEDTDGNGSWDLNQSRTHNNVNEIGTIAASAGANWVDPVHDRAGNMVLIPQPADPTMSYTATWDPWNRLAKLVDGMTTVGQYVYDGGARRTEKLVSGTTRRFYYSRRWQILEERLGSSSSAERQFVWGLRYIDDLVLRDRDADGNTSTGNLGVSGSGLEERLYGLHDSNWNITSLADASGSVQERYGYAAYGTPAFFSSAFGSRPSSLYDWETLYASYRWDSESEVYQVRHRWLIALLGRWLQRDPFEYDDSGNLYEYGVGRPLVVTDPSGGLFIIGAAGSFFIELGFQLHVEGRSWEEIRWGEVIGVTLVGALLPGPLGKLLTAVLKQRRWGAWSIRANQFMRQRAATLKLSRKERLARERWKRRVAKRRQEADAWFDDIVSALQNGLLISGAKQVAKGAAEALCPPEECETIPSNFASYRVCYVEGPHEEKTVAKWGEDGDIVAIGPASPKVITYFDAMGRVICVKTDFDAEEMDVAPTPNPWPDGKDCDQVLREARANQRRGQ